MHVTRPIEQRKRDQKCELSVAEMIHRLYDIVPKETHLSIPPEVSIEYGSPAERIIEAAKQRSADLIVLGVRSARGHLGAATHVERRTAHEVVAHASCPVLTVRELEDGVRKQRAKEPEGSETCDPGSPNGS